VAERVGRQNLGKASCGQGDGFFGPALSEPRIRTVRHLDQERTKFTTAHASLAKCTNTHGLLGVFAGDLRFADRVSRSSASPSARACRTRTARFKGLLDSLTQHRPSLGAKGPSAGQPHAELTRHRAPCGLGLPDCCHTCVHGEIVLQVSLTAGAASALQLPADPRTGLSGLAIDRFSISCMQVGPKPAAPPGIIVRLKDRQVGVAAAAAAAGTGAVRPIAPDLQLYSIAITDGKSAEAKQRPQKCASCQVSWGPAADTLETTPPVLFAAFPPARCSAARVLRQGLLPPTAGVAYAVPDVWVSIAGSRDLQAVQRPPPPSPRRRPPPPPSARTANDAFYKQLWGLVSGCCCRCVSCRVM
jgi:hypothetical protein